MTNDTASVPTSPTPPAPMRRVWLPHHLCGAAWRSAVEFTRPTRASGPSPTQAALLFPAMLFVASISQVYSSRDARGTVAVLGVKKAGAKGWWLPLLGIAAVAVAITVTLPLLGVEFTNLQVAAGLMGFLVVLSVPAGLATHLSKKAWQGLEPVELTPGPARAQWVVNTAAAAPGLDAIRTLFIPCMEQIIPAGETVKAEARNRNLAHRYAEHGFQRRTKREYDLYRQV